MSQFEKETMLWTIEKCINQLDNIDDLSIVLKLVKSKRKHLATNNAAELIIGEKVRITGSGKIEEGIVVKINRTKAVIDVDGTSWTVPFSMIRKLGDTNE